jgi:uncharacterized membrane protein YdjX (TVP38/TMEM64 family)
MHPPMFLFVVIQYFQHRSKLEGPMTDLQPGKKRVPYKFILLGLLFAAGIIVQQSGWFDWRMLLEQGEEYAHAWWFVPVIIAAQVVLYTFALPGSSMIWVAGLFYEPLVATVIVVAGGVGGAAAAYGFTRRMSTEIAAKTEASVFFGFLRKHSDWATLSAMRSLPNFPHSVINYGAGILRVPLPRFFFSTVIGFTAKGYLYASMIHHAVKADSLSDVIDLKTLAPLFILAALFMLGKLIQRSRT